MRIAVFTNQFPSRTSTFFARDMRPLLDSGIELDIFPIYPLDANLWRYVPDILNQDVLPRSRVHHLGTVDILRFAMRPNVLHPARFIRDVAAVSASAIKFGVGPVAKSAYVFMKALSWAQRAGRDYDHVLAYWGNYAGTCAYIFHRLLRQEIPFSIFLHAGIDLYENQVYLRQKLLYADNIITCSKFNRQFLHDRFSDVFPVISEKIHVHQHGLDFTQFLYEPEDRLPRRILGVGSLEKYKGFEYLLLSAAELIRRGVKVEVELVGDGKEEQALKNLAKKLAILDNVKFRGWLHPEEVRKAMRNATALVHPSPDLGDGVPNVIKEAMALGTPVIASSVAGIPELLANGRNGILVPAKDVKALAHSIETILSQEQLRRTYAKAARKHAEKEFDLWRAGRCLADLLSSTTRLKAGSLRSF